MVIWKANTSSKLKTNNILYHFKILIKHNKESPWQETNNKIKLTENLISGMLELAT